MSRSLSEMSIRELCIDYTETKERNRAAFERYCETEGQHKERHEETLKETYERQNAIAREVMERLTN